MNQTANFEKKKKKQNKFARKRKKKKINKIYIECQMERERFDA